MTKLTALLSAVATALSLSNLPTATAFAPPNSNIQSPPPIQTSTPTALHATRRSLFTTLSTAALLSALPPPSHAANAPPTPEELARIQTGYDNLQYLLANWEKETTVCRENGGECKRDADPVRKYLGLRSTTDPLFQIEKVFNKVKYMDNIDVDMLDGFFEATEDW